MHFESAAEMSKGNSSYKDLFWHVKTSNSKDSLPAQSSLLSSPQSCCTKSIMGLRNCWPWMSTEWAAKCLKGKSHLWEQAVSQRHSQEPRSESWVPSSNSAQLGHSRWHCSSSSHGQHSGQQKHNQALTGIPQTANPSILQIISSLWAAVGHAQHCWLDSSASLSKNPL